MTLPTSVTLVEVGPRDGLQNEAQLISCDDKIQLIESLVSSGIKRIEAVSFVSPKWVPQMADSAAVMAAISRQPNVIYAELAPNLKGFEAALALNANEVLIFGSASETFSQKNLNCSIAESLKRFREVAAIAPQYGIRLRGSISCALGCPYEGEIALSAVLDMVGHFYDTYGQAIANIYASLEVGVTIFHSSVAGLGGCPYARGASGNVATEDVLYLLQGLGIKSGINLNRIIAIGRKISSLLGHPYASKAGTALSANC